MCVCVQQLAAYEYREYHGLHTITGFADIAKWLEEKLNNHA